MTRTASQTPAAKYNFFLVPTSKFIVLSLATLSLYEIYWFYKNWAAVRDAEKSRIFCLVRALFAPFTFCYLLQRMRVPHIGILTVSYAVLSLVAGRLPDPWWLISYLTFVPLVYVQSRLAEREGQKLTSDSYSKKEIALVVIGGIFLVLVILSLSVQA